MHNATKLYKDTELLEIYLLTGDIYTSWFISHHLNEMRNSKQERGCRWAMEQREEGRWQMAAHIGMSSKNDGRYVQPLG